MILQIEAFGEDIVARDLTRFAARAIDARPAFIAIAKDVRDELAKQFESEGRHASGGWAELAEATQAAKEARGLDPRILHATLELQQSLTEENGGDTVVLPQSLSITSDSESGVFHQTGTSRMPARPPVAFTPIAAQNFVRTLQRYIVEGKLGTAFA